MDKQVVEILNKINFVERFNELCDQYAFDLKESFENYDNQRVLEILHEVGYMTPKHMKRENFFQSVKKVAAYRFEHKIKTKYGIVELIWDVMKDNKYYMGNSFSNLERYFYHPSEMHPLPIFRNYEDLRGILTIAFQMHEDMTTEFLKVHGDST